MGGRNRGAHGKSLLTVHLPGVRDRADAPDGLGKRDGGASMKEPCGLEIPDDGHRGDSRGGTGSQHFSACGVHEGVFP